MYGAGILLISVDGDGADVVHWCWQESHWRSIVIAPWPTWARNGAPALALHDGQGIGKRQSFACMLGLPLGNNAISPERR